MTAEHTNNLEAAFCLPAKSFRTQDPALMHLQEVLWLSLPQHLRDSADVGMALAEDWLPRSITDRLANRYSLSGDEVRALLGFLAGTHDLGKAELSWQSRLEQSPTAAWLADKALSSGLFGEAQKRCDPTFKPQHSVTSDVILRRQLEMLFPGADYTAICTLTAAAGCHHGVPSNLPYHELLRDDTKLPPLNLHLDRHGASCARVWAALTRDILDRTGAHSALEKIIGAGGVTIMDQLTIAGFVSMSDWIASNQELFPLTESGAHSSSESRAAAALDQLNLTQSWSPEPDRPIPFSQRFGWPENAMLRACQRTAQAAVKGLDDPALVVISEEMGRGKTEAALLAAEEIAKARGAGGLAFGLPTQVTANAMLPRISDWLRSFSTAENQHSLRLAHGRAHLSPEFERLVRHTRAVNAEQNENADDGVIAHTWFSGRKSLLSDFSVSTVDQILMTALKSRYVTLRHLGVSGKVVIFDEVHSLDPYSTAYLERTLMWLAAHQTSVILLSATLDSAVQNRLEQAYARGLGRRQPTAAAQLPSYPQVSATTLEGTQRYDVDTLDEHRRVHLDIIDDNLAFLRRNIEQLTSEGGVVGIVCNTVQRAQDAYRVLSDFWPEETVLLHSQLTAAQRAQIETHLTDQLGKKSSRDSADPSSQRPYRQIVVGTQVLEQSLDVDFDLLVSDFAPVDALAQRAGRLHRHDRPDSDRPSQLRCARMLLRGFTRRGPQPPLFDPGSESIYGGYRLLASAAALNDNFNEGAWCIRHDLYPKVEAVGTGSIAVPSEWGSEFQQAQIDYKQAVKNACRRASAHQISTPGRTNNNLGRALDGAGTLDADRSEEIVAASVRDIEPSLEAILVMQRDGLLYPLPWLAPGQTAAISETQAPPTWLSKLLADSTVRLPRWLVPPYQVDEAIDSLEATRIGAWQSDFRLRGQLVLTIDSDFQGQVLGTHFRFHPYYGFLREEQFNQYKLQEIHENPFADEQEEELYEDL